MRLLLGLMLCAAAFAQSEKPKDRPAVRFYRLDFVVKELDESTVMNSRNYSMTIATDHRASPSSIRTGSRVPYQVSSGNYQFADVGVNIDCRWGNMLEIPAQPDGMLVLTINAEISSVAPGGLPSAHPIIRQTKWGSLVLLPEKKPTIVFSSDDAASRRKMQLELTATPIG